VKRTFLAASFAIFACVSAYAHDPQRDGSFPIESIFAGLIEEQDVALAMGYLRESLDAALQGREPPLPPAALVQRGEVIANEVKRRGAASVRSVLDVLEGILREGVREEPRLPPSSPMRRI
jgi:hypothetical protein